MGDRLDWRMTQLVVWKGVGQDGAWPNEEEEEVMCKPAATIPPALRKF